MSESQIIEQIASEKWTGDRVVLNQFNCPKYFRQPTAVFMLHLDQASLQKALSVRAALRTLRVFPIQYQNGNYLVSLDDPRGLMTTYNGMSHSRASDADISIPAPQGKEYLPFQKAGIAYAQARSGTLFGDEMGLGKTIQAIGSCNLDASIKDVIVVCPAYLKLNWKAEIEAWSTKKADIRVIFSGDSMNLSGRVEDGSCRYTIINYEILKKYETRLGCHVFDAIIVDEAHYIKSLDAIRTKQVLSIKARRKFALTGTPALNRPFELYPIIKLLSDRAPTKEEFGKKYCGRGFGGAIDYRGCSNPNALQQFLRKTFMVRRLKRDVLKELPPKRRQIIEMPSPQEIRMVLDMEAGVWRPHEDVLLSIKQQMDEAQMAEDDEKFMSLAEQFGRKMSIAFTELAAIRAELSLSRVPMIAHHAQEFLQGTDEKLVIFFYHKKACFELQKHLSGHGARVITSDVSMLERNQHVQAFQQDPECRVIIGTIGAMGTGVTLHASSTVIMAELDWRPGILAQAEDRTHRIGQTNAVLCIYFVYEDSVDSKMIFDITSKMAMLNQMLDAEGEAAARPANPAPSGGSRKKRKAIKVARTHHDAVLRAVRMVAGNNSDLARSTNSVGFSKFDSWSGMRLASKESLTAGELNFAATLAWKYRRQIDPDLIRSIWSNGDPFHAS